MQIATYELLRFYVSACVFFFRNVGYPPITSTAYIAMILLTGPDGCFVIACYSPIKKSHSVCVIPYSDVTACCIKQLSTYSVLYINEACGLFGAPLRLNAEKVLHSRADVFLLVELCIQHKKLIA